MQCNLYDYNDAYILVRGNTTIIGHQATQVAFKNYALFTKCITKIDRTTIDDAEDLDLCKMSCQCKIWYNIAQIILKQQEV